MKNIDVLRQARFGEQSTQTDFYISDKRYGKLVKKLTLDESKVGPKPVARLDAARIVRALPLGEQGSDTADISKVAEWGEWLSREYQMEEGQLMRLKYIEHMLRQRGSLHANDSTAIIEKSITELGRKHHANIEIIDKNQARSMRKLRKSVFSEIKGPHVPTHIDGIVERVRTTQPTMVLPFKSEANFEWIRDYDDTDLIAWIGQKLLMTSVEPSKSMATEIETGFLDVENLRHIRNTLTACRSKLHVTYKKNLSRINDISSCTYITNSRSTPVSQKRHHDIMNDA